ncbi:hypothetical protein ILUMI_13254 [Ignelater luminosus]|uniref:Craniofacial development protein 1 n=1 Tax=Ignelater luminosus TaxID=2038154 RepID=A0A8K0GC58_IGNLU|nr:hypothetical protein ILUMI_13254 [Ignelater luminosus]
MNIADLPDDSESSDEDYVPEGPNTELPSEEESDGDVEDDLISTENSNKRGTKRQKKVGKSKKKRRSNIEDLSPTPKKNEQEEKQKEATSSLWADFIKDTGFKTRAERLQTSKTSDEETNSVDNVKQKETKVDKVEPQKKIKVTEVYKFAGEEFKVEKEISADSSDARLATSTSKANSSRKSAVGGRLNSILGSLGKKQKINTLEKSKLDWEQFKKDEDIQDELQAYSKSKDGYLEKQDFLERADLRRFEIEKGIRNTLRNNRMNNFNM